MQNPPVDDNRDVHPDALYDERRDHHLAERSGQRRG